MQFPVTITYIPSSTHSLMCLPLTSQPQPDPGLLFGANQQTCLGKART